MHLVLVQLESDSIAVDVGLTVKILVGYESLGEIEMTCEFREAAKSRAGGLQTSCTYPNRKINSPAIPLPIEQRQRALDCHHLQI